MTVFPRSFKQFNSTLMKTRIQTGSGSGHLERLLVQSWKPKINWSPKYSEIRPSQLWSVKKYGGGYVACLKLIKERSSDTDFTSRRSRFNQNAKVAFQLKHEPRVQGKCRLQTRVWETSRLMQVWGTRVSFQTWVWATMHLTRVWETPYPTSNVGLSNSASYASLSNSASHASLSNSASHMCQSNSAAHFKCGSE